MVDQKKLQDLINRIERMRGRTLGIGTKITYFGDGISPGFNSVELLEFLKPLQNTHPKESYEKH